MLLSNAQFHSPTVAQRLPSFEVDMHMNIAALLSTQTKCQRDAFARIQYQVVNTTIVRQGTSTVNENEWHTKIMTTMKEIKKLTFMVNMPCCQICRDLS
jgi:hypothetical protein